jgi:hypothetical protein
MLKAYKSYYNGELISPQTRRVLPPSPPPLSGEQVSQGMKSTEEIADFLGRTYLEHLEMDGMTRRD